MIVLYLLGMVIGVLVALILKHTMFKGEPVPFVMELPNYRLPSMGNMLRLVWEKAKDFLTRAFTIIFLASVVIWFLQTFDIRFNVVADSADNISIIRWSHRSYLYATWFWRLAGINGIDYGICGKRKRREHSHGSFGWIECCFSKYVYSFDRFYVFGLCSFIYTVCCCYCCGKKRTRRQACYWSSDYAMCGCLGSGVYCSRYWSCSWLRLVCALCCSFVSVQTASMTRVREFYKMRLPD